MTQAKVATKFSQFAKIFANYTNLLKALPENPETSLTDQWRVEAKQIIRRREVKLSRSWGRVGGGNRPHRPVEVSRPLGGMIEA